MEVCEDENNEEKKIVGRKYEDLNKNSVFDSEEHGAEPELFARVVLTTLRDRIASAATSTRNRAALAAVYRVQ